MQFKLQSWILLTALLCLVLAGCGKASKHLPTAPEDLVEAVHSACMNGTYEAAAYLFKDGEAVWKVRPETIRSMVDVACVGRGQERLDRYSIESQQAHGDFADIRTYHGDYHERLLPDPNPFKLRGLPLSHDWQLLQVNGGWQVVSIS